MQEEIENKIVVMITKCTKLTATELRKALEKVLAKVKSSRSRKQQKQKEVPHGKMTVKELAQKDKGMQSIEVNDSTIGSFNRVARKNGIDFAPFKVKGENKYLVFFKAPDWEHVSSNVEKLPWFARMLKENTPKLKVKPVADEELFALPEKRAGRTGLIPSPWRSPPP